MPYISTKTNVTVDKARERSIKDKLGQAIALIPGKNESWLMCSFEDKQPMYFRGDGESPIAYIEVKIFGSAKAAEYDALTNCITEIISSELLIDPDKIYIKYEEVSVWGWNGANF